MGSLLTPLYEALYQQYMKIRSQVDPQGRCARIISWQPLKTDCPQYMGLSQGTIQGHHHQAGHVSP